MAMVGIRQHRLLPTTHLSGRLVLSFIHESRYYRWCWDGKKHDRIHARCRATEIDVTLIDVDEDSALAHYRAPTRSNQEPTPPVRMLRADAIDHGRTV